MICPASWHESWSTTTPSISCALNSLQETFLSRHSFCYPNEFIGESSSNSTDLHEWKLSSLVLAMSLCSAPFFLSCCLLLYTQHTTILMANLCRPQRGWHMKHLCTLQMDYDLQRDKKRRVMHLYCHADCMVLGNTMHVGVAVYDPGVTNLARCMKLSRNQIDALLQAKQDCQERLDAIREDRRIVTAHIHEVLTITAWKQWPLYLILKSLDVSNVLLCWGVRPMDVEVSHSMSKILLRDRIGLSDIRNSSSPFTQISRVMVLPTMLQLQSCNFAAWQILWLSWLLAAFESPERWYKYMYCICDMSWIIHYICSINSIAGTRSAPWEAFHLDESPPYRNG